MKGSALGEGLGGIDPQQEGNKEQEELVPGIRTVGGDSAVILIELFGIPQVEARTYFCPACVLMILSQEVVWEGAFEAHCPHCGGELGEPGSGSVPAIEIG